MTDAYVTHQPESTGKKIDAETFTQNDGTLVYRQRVDIPDGVEATGVLLQQVLTELKVLSLVTALAFNMDSGVVDDLRSLVTSNQ